jgi:hypothetical protein
MQCYYCGAQVSAHNKTCPTCKHPRTRLLYVPFCAVAGGITGSLIGFTLGSVAGALLGGLVGILVCELAARAMFQKRTIG